MPSPATLPYRCGGEDEEVYVNCGNCRARVWAHERCICETCGREFCSECTPNRRLLTEDAADAVRELMFELKACFQCVHKEALSRILRR